MPDHAVAKGLQRAELARRTGCNLETVRYYERRGCYRSRRARGAAIGTTTRCMSGASASC
jgi:hypothetical protein